MNLRLPISHTQVVPSRESQPLEPSHQTFYHATYLSPLGQITLAASDDALIGLWFDGQKHFAKTLPANSLINTENPILRQTKTWLDAYFCEENPDPRDIPLCPSGTSFQLIVWQILATIPYGQVVTYGELAHQVAQKLHKPKMSAQAVGAAVGRNPISIIIPCHRVVGTKGALTGYAGGLDKKRLLLQLENSLT